MVNWNRKKVSLYPTIYSPSVGFNEGIFAIRYSLKTLSDYGYHNVALQKASGSGFATFEYLLRHNATTMWESWWWVLHC